MDLKKSVQQIDSLPSPDFILKKIVDTASSTSASAKELNDIVSKDSGFVSKLLKLANSSYYGLPKKVSKLTEAIMILGFKTVRNMALSIFANEQLFSFKSEELELRELWIHSLSVATIGETIAERIGFSNKEELFLCGLLHDIGKTVQGILFPLLFDAIVKVSRMKGWTYYRTEKELGVPTHEQFAEMLLEKWNFPELVSLAATRHHRTDDFGSSVYTDVVFITSLATYIAERLKYGDNGAGAPILVKHNLWKELGLTPLIMKDIVHMSAEKIGRLSEFYNPLSS
ncbi:MAG TPA: HDOD domain-containing protein [Thermotogota bacterium]|jgi:putative nucleotidyltransferase with HDIG domain|nr:HDOD domain-containing protein [Thermotogota bacterium]MDD8053843.1 HDOD domain-containing protein [Thermotogota bacterium]NLZ14953.1 HDOD domain-containing protein [Thermotogaceae bacterium]HPE41567.1 HDOD domain-containing protein [Thermotogota bacterium]